MARLILRFQRPFIPYIILIISLIITCLTTYYVNASTYERDSLRFRNAVSDTTNSIEITLGTYTSLLRGAAGFFAADQDITQSQFSSYVNRLHLEKHYPGITCIGFTEIVSNGNKENYIQNIRNSGEVNFDIKPRGNRKEYYVIRFIAPYDNNQQAEIGYDQFVNPILRKAMEEADDTGLSASSQKIMLQDITSEQKESGFLIFIPVYRNGVVPSTLALRRKYIQGFIFGILSTRNLLSNILADKELPRLLTYQIYTGNTTAASQLLYDSSGHKLLTHSTYIPRFHTTSHIAVAGNIWTIQFSNHPQFDVASQKDLPPYIFIGGILISIMFFLLSRSQYVARTKAEIFADKLLQSQTELKKAIGIRDNFISIASHELRTPVTSLKVYTEVLLRQSADKNDEKMSGSLKKIIKQIDKLTILIQDLLDVSKIQSNQLVFRVEKFDLNRIVKEVIENMQLTANHRILLEGFVTKKVWGDREKITQVLINLLTNAIKYSPGARKVFVVIKDNRNGALISVRDSGIGIGREYQKKIFGRFYRINEKNVETYPGLGIGLYISQTIIKRHGSEITIISKKGKGSIFQFVLPYSKNSIPR
jgi:signal transduction histidine kinase